jgi:spore coat polysaccharide biosynthesis protein SpsF (cytidylyltransferase family)
VLLKLAFISALVFEISQLQSAQDRVVLARTNAIIVRSEHYELVAMCDPGGQKSCAGSAQKVLRKFYRIFDCMSIAMNCGQSATYPDDGRANRFRA